jgi:hypothetical protein
MFYLTTHEIEKPYGRGEKIEDVIFDVNKKKIKS